MTASSSDFRTTLYLANSVLQVKEQLAREYPGHPPAGRQKLIVAGQLLRDEMVMKDVFAKVRGEREGDRRGREGKE